MTGSRLNWLAGQFHFFFSTGRCILLPCKQSPYETPDNGYQILQDLFSVNERIADPKKPFSFLIKGFHDLYFTMDDMDADLKKTLTSYDCISSDGTKVRRYIKLLGDTIQEVRKLPGMKSGREVLSYSLLLVFAKVLDLWLAPKPDCKWFTEGGSKFFFSEFLPDYLQGSGHLPEELSELSSDEKVYYPLPFFFIPSSFIIFIQGPGVVCK